MKSFLALLAVASTSMPAIAQVDAGYANDLSTLEATVRNNLVTQDGYWLEMLNGLDEWEKVVLVFGYFGSADAEACVEIQQHAAQTAPYRDFRCTPVN